MTQMDRKGGGSWAAPRPEGVLGARVWASHSHSHRPLLLLGPGPPTLPPEEASSRALTPPPAPFPPPTPSFPRFSPPTPPPKEASCGALTPPPAPSPPLTPSFPGSARTPSRWTTRCPSSSTFSLPRSVAYARCVTSNNSFSPWDGQDKPRGSPGYNHRL